MMDARIKSGHDRVWLMRQTIIITDAAGHAFMDDPTPKVEFGVTPPEVMASMPGIDFVRAIFAGKLPSPPIMQTIEPFDCTAAPGIVEKPSTPGLQDYHP